ncbi:MopE-related protein [Lewinella sp. IMCC34191]|uniref:MopE-related protein n=1 Tax=Lewinella sp. IMCC34191 TaxID=2259172 RepID=UPI000E282EDD|nr:MopE-related protein [Lewinella sp. IMCC34191]
MTHLYATIFSRYGHLIAGVLFLLLGCNSLKAQLQGTYTIGGNSPDYGTITAAVTDLDAEGVSGPVVFDIRPGTYSEQLELSAVSGASATNTITFRSQNGDPEDVILSYEATSSADNYVLQFNGATHYRLQNVSVSSMGSSYNRLISVTGESSDLLFQGNRLLVLASNSGYPVLEISTFLGSDIRILDNYISGGYTGISLQGISSQNLTTGTIIRNNVIEDFRGYGLQAQTLAGGEVTGNRIIGRMASASYGLYVNNWDGTASEPLLVANNFVSLPGGGSYAVLISGSDYLNFYHNSVNLAESGSYGFYLSSSPNASVKNNIFRAGTGYAVYLSSLTGLDMDYNDLYTEGSYLAYYNNTQVTDLADWQSTSGQGANSVSFDPQFVSDTDLHASARALADAGVGIAAVSTDIDGESRDNSPSIGADEYSAAGFVPLSGTYTIGASGSRNFVSFGAAVAAMRTNGLAGAVTFEVASGTYEEQVVLPDISGGSGSNTITFESASGNAEDVVLTYAATQSDSNYVMRLTNASDVRLRHLTLEATGTSYNRVVEIANRADNIVVENNQLLISAVNSGYEALAANVSLGSDIHLLDNYMSGGYTGISLQGISSQNPTTGTIIRGNVIEDFRGYGLQAQTLTGGEVTGNRIIGRMASASYGLFVNNWDGTASEPLLVANNFISLPGGGSYAVLISGSDYLNFYHNSVNLASSGSYGFYLSSSPNASVKNNIFRAGTGYAVYLNSLTGLDMDYNDLYSEGSYLAYYNNTQVTDLAAWRSTSGQGAHSVSFDPQFVSDTDLHASAPALADAGVAIATISKDIDGESRDNSPSIGADEYSAAGFVPLSGTYTIGASGSRNFVSFGAAVAAMRTNGLAGAVTFEVASGTYEEQVVLPDISGGSGSNTITFESASGNAEDVVLTYAATQSDSNYVMRLTNASDVRLRHLTLEATGTSYNRVVEIANRADNIVVENNQLLISAVNSGYEALAANVSLGSDIHLLDNYMSGGYTGISLQGTSSQNPTTGTIIRGNVIEDFRGYGLQAQTLTGGEVTGNRIIGRMASASYGLFVNNWDGTASEPLLVANNFISLPGGGSYTVLISGSDYLNFYHNSVNLASSGSYGFYLSSSPNASVKNNIFRAGTGYAVYLNSLTGLDMDYNDLYSEGSYLAYYNNTQVTDLAAWRSTSGQGAHSVSFDPQFVSDTDLHASAPALADAGVAIATISTDIDGESRDNSPSIGADEYSAAGFVPLSGTYTIGASGSRNFVSFGAAVAAMRTNGLAGAVTFEVASGTYEEQVVLPDISGGSASNTITFESASGNAEDVVLTYAATQSDSNYVLRLTNASDVRLRHLTLEATGTSYNRVLEIANRADNIILEGNKLQVSTSNASYPVLDVNATLGSNIQILDNDVSGGYYGISFQGTSSQEQPTGTVIRGNRIEDFRGYGLQTQRLLGGEITDNRIIGRSSFVSYGMSLNSSDGTASSPLLVANNFISLPGGGSYAVLISGSDYLNFYHNSVNLAGSGSYGFYLSSSPNARVKNNIFRAGTGYAVYLNSLTGLDMDYNDLYAEGTYLAYYNNTHVTDLAAWQTASGQDANSLSVDPQFVSETDLHAQNLALSEAGVALSEITTDIDGEDRGDPPSIGADEFGTDGDGIDDDEDNCPSAFNPNQEDFDGDGIGDVCDADDDNDGVNDEADCDPLDASVSVPTTFYADRDRDGYGDASTATEACFAPTGYVTQSGDCDDLNGTVYPGAPELCDGLDNDCDGSTDEGATLTTFYADDDADGLGDPNDSVEACAAPAGYVSNALDCDDTNASIGQTVTFYADTDDDGYGDASITTTGCVAPDGYVAQSGDCNDSDDTVYPGAPELCDGIDNDCDGITDEGVGATTYYADDDGDGLGDPNDSTNACTQPLGYVNNALDCDDTNAAIGEEITFYADSDNDGYGDVSSTTVACSAPAGYSAQAGDCDDSDATVYPGAPELCDGVDNDCNGSIDDGVTNTTFYADADGDGLGDPTVFTEDCAQPNGYVNNALDCDDTDAAIGGEITFYADSDNDGYGDASVTTTACTVPDGYVVPSGDCDDTDDTVYPGAPELCDGKDNDCDGTTDEGVSSTTYYADADDDGLGDPNASTEACVQPDGYVDNDLDCDDTDAAIGEETTFYADADNDGYGDASSPTVACSAPSGYVAQAGDCDDSDATVYPGAPELCDGIDNDCDGLTDEDVTNTTFYADADGDGLGDPTVSIEDCAQPAGYVNNALDCDDADATIGAETTFYADTDNDGYGDASSSTTACSAPTGYVAQSGDCDDSDATVYPGAPELCDGVDNDCNGSIDEGATGTTFYADTDGDGYGDVSTTITACTPPAGYVPQSGDCDDSDASVYPGAPELCDGLDNDCDGMTDEDVTNTTFYADADGDGLGDPNVSTEDCSSPAGYVVNALDCDDTDASIGEAIPYYADADRDGYGDASTMITACTAPDGYVSQADDCDDSDPLAYPGQTWYIDADGDGYPESSLTGCERPTDGFAASELTSVEIDNCPATYNPEQTDSDGNGTGDACDSAGENTETEFWLEGECAMVGTKWTVATDREASNQKYVTIRGLNSLASPPADVAENRLRFTLERAAAGSFYLHVRAFTPDRGSDSFWVRLNDGSWMEWNNIDCNRRFTWATLPDMLVLTAGTNTIDIAYRERGTMLDKVYISLDDTLPAGFGEPATNCSELANQPPTAMATASVTQGVAPLTVQLDGSASYDYDGTIVDYDWSWTGGSATGATPSVTLVAGTYDIKLTVTDDAGDSNSATVTVRVATPGGVPSTTPFSFEAECTIRDRDWRLSEDVEASGNRFVSFTGCRCEGTPSMQMAGQYLNYDFVTSKAETFYLFLRLDAPDVGRNSFWIRMDDGDWIKMWREADGSVLLTNGFEWRRVNDDAVPVSFDLAPGEHTITVAAREPGTKLDKLVLSAEPELPLGTGPDAQNCSLYQRAIVKGLMKELVLPYEEELFAEADLSVFPNPVADHLIVELNDGYTGRVDMTVVDGLGRRVRHLQYDKEGQSLRTELSVADLPPGIYYLQLQGKCQTVERFVKR